MATPRYPTKQYLAGDFVSSAGCVLFRQLSGEPLEICILHHLTRNEWLLPKGRKDRGETIERTAVRETYEETGYPCRLWPQRMPTRAPVPGSAGDAGHGMVIGDALVEPIAVTIRDLVKGDIKMIFWYIALVEEGIQKVEGTQMENENFESVFMQADEAVRQMTFDSDRDIVKKALEIVQGNA